MERVYIGFVLIIVTAFIKVIILFILFVIVFQKYLRKPLKNLEDKVSQINFEDLKPINSGLTERNQIELKSLERTINGMINGLIISKKRINFKTAGKRCRFVAIFESKRIIRKKSQ